MDRNATLEHPLRGVAYEGGIVMNWSIAHGILVWVRLRAASCYPSSSSASC